MSGPTIDLSGAAVGLTRGAVDLSGAAIELTRGGIDLSRPEMTCRTRKTPRRTQGTTRYGATFSPDARSSARAPLRMCFIA